MEWQRCFTQQSNAEIQVLAGHADQQEAEATAELVLSGLPLLSPSPECAFAIKPFLCLYLFGLCDASNQPHQVTQEDCVHLRDDVCAQEWTQAETFIELPDCSALLRQEEECLKGIYNFPVYSCC